MKILHRKTKKCERANGEIKSRYRNLIDGKIQIEVPAVDSFNPLNSHFGETYIVELSFAEVEQIVAMAVRYVPGNQETPDNIRELCDNLRELVKP